MKIDSCVKNFLETYDREAIDSIDSLSKAFGIVENRYKMEGFNLNESFEKFRSFLEGYTDFLVNHDKYVSELLEDAIAKPIDKFMLRDDILMESDLYYKDLPDFIKSYIENVQKTVECVNVCKDKMFEESVDEVYIGMINDYCDKFIEPLDAKFEKCMNKALTASGYITKKKREEKRKLFSEKTTETPVFL